MPQIKSRQLIAKLDRKRLLLAGVIAVVGLGAWGLLREKPRTVDEDAWDSIVFPEIANTTFTDHAGESPSEQPRTEATPRIEPVVPGLRVEVAANVPLVLDNERERAPYPQRRAGEVSMLSDAIRLEGGIEPLETTAH